MFSKRFEKKAFKAAVKDNVKTLYRKTIDELRRSSYSRQYPMQSKM